MDHQPSDSELVTRAKSGELAAFEALVVRYERKVFSLALRMLRQQEDAQDITQETFLSAMEHLKDFRGEASFATWIMRIATHAAIKVIRKRKGFVSLERNTEPGEGWDTIPHPEFIADWRHSPESLVNQNETQRILEEALSKLDDKHRMVFVMRDIEGLSIKETAQALDLSEANTKVRLLRARLLLREELTRAFGDRAKGIAPHHHAENNP